jgi:uncharacterized protein YkwD
VKHLKNLAIIFAAVSIFAALLPVASASASTGDWSCYRFTAAERAFAHKTNQARAQHGLQKLSLDRQLSKTSSRHTSQMVSKKLLYHTTNAQFYSRVTSWSSLGENVGEGGGVTSLQHAFMQSPEHRRNVLDKSYRYLGVGVTKKNGVMWVTVQFESSSNPGTTLSAPSCRRV